MATRERGTICGISLTSTLAPVIRARPNFLPRQSRMRGSCGAGWVIFAKQQSAGAMQAGHDRPDRHAGYLGDLAIAELVQLAQHDRLAQRRRERLDQMVETPQIGSVFEQDDARRSVALKPAIAGAPQDLEQPALGVAVAIAVEIAKRPQTSLLHDIGGIGIVARQPS